MRLRLFEILKIHRHKFIRLTLYWIGSVVCSTALAVPQQKNQPLTMNPVAYPIPAPAPAPAPASISIEYPTQLEISQSEKSGKKQHLLAYWSPSGSIWPLKNVVVLM